MSWHFSRALVEAYSEANSLAGEPSVPLSGTPTPQAFLSPDRMTAFSRLFRFGMTFKPLTESLGADVLTWFLAASPVRTSHALERAQESKESEAVCGVIWPESLARFNPDSQSWRTRQLSLFEDLEESLETWPAWGIAVDGECWALTCAEPIITAPDGGWLPTPTCADAKNAGGRQNQYDLSRHAREITGKRLNVLYSEWTMDWVVGWTGITPLETDKFQQWLDSHGEH